MKATSIAPELVALTSSPVLDATTNSTGTPNRRANSLPRSTVTPLGSTLASLTTKKADRAGAAATPILNFPAGASSLSAAEVGPSDGEAAKPTAAQKSIEQNGASFVMLAPKCIARGPAQQKRAE